MTIPNRVSDVLTRTVITIGPQQQVAHAVALMIEHDISGLPVVDSKGTLLGILTERDCIEVALTSGYFDELGGPVSEYMSSPVQTVDPDDNLMDVAQRLCDSPYRRFPVVRDAQVVGIISRRDVLRTLQQGSWFTEPRGASGH